MAGPGSICANASLTLDTASLTILTGFQLSPPPSSVMPRLNGPLARGENALIGSVESKLYLILEPSKYILED